MKIFSKMDRMQLIEERITKIVGIERLRPIQKETIGEKNKRIAQAIANALPEILKVEEDV